MKIQPIAGAGQVQDKSTPEHVRTAKAVNAFKQGVSSYDKPGVTNGSQAAVPNQNAISAEELGAVKAQTTATTDNIAEVETTSMQEEIAQVKEEQKSKEEDPALSRQFAQLARQEKALRIRNQEIKAKEQALAAREAALSAPKSPEVDLSKYVAKDKLKSDFLSVAAETGLSYDEIAQQFMNQQPRDPRTEATISRLEAKIQALELANENNQKMSNERDQEQVQTALKQIRVDVKNLVNSDPNYETVKATGSINDVVDLIKRTWDKDQILLSVEEAAEEVENYLVEEYMKAAKIQKIQKRLQASAQPVSPAKTTQEPQKQQQPMKTLTNAQSSSRQLSARERALLAFKGELGKS